MICKCNKNSGVYGIINWVTEYLGSTQGDEEDISEYEELYLHELCINNIEENQNLF